MYIPKEIIWFILGFISFPVMCYVIYKAKGGKNDGHDN